MEDKGGWCLLVLDIWGGRRWVVAEEMRGEGEDARLSLLMPFFCLSVERVFVVVGGSGRLG